MTTKLGLAGRGVALAATAGVLAGVGAIFGVGARATASTADAPIPNLVGGTSVSVTSAPVGPRVPDGFLGISMEYHSLEDYVGGNPRKPDPAFLQLLRNLAPTGTSVLRLGGDSTDWTWWPVPRMAPPGGAKFDLTPQYAALLKAVAQDVHAKLLLGINFEADSQKVAAYEEQQLTSHIGNSLIDAFELGNEPELYSAYSWYKARDGKGVYGRPRDYTPLAFLMDYAYIASALPKEPLAGPDSGSAQWLNLPEFLHTQPRLSLVTLHTYPLRHCGPGAAPPAEAQLFWPSSLQLLANEVGSWVQIASARHLPLRIDEMNSVTCGGWPAVSGSFGPALWALNILPMYAEAGTVGVNFHTTPFTWQSLLEPVSKPVFIAGGLTAVQPEYYGLLAFAKLAPPGSQMLKSSVSSGDGLFEWADRTPSGQENVVLTNPSSVGGNVNVSVPSQTAPATVTMLRSNGLSSTAQPTLAGQSLSASTGQLVGTVRSTSVKASGNGHHTYEVRLPAASAAILSFGAVAST